MLWNKKRCLVSACFVACAALLLSLVSCDVSGADKRSDRYSSSEQGEMDAEIKKVETKTPDHNETQGYESDFEDDSVLVIITNEKSLEFHEYTVEDFPDINCISVEDLSPYADRSIEEKRSYLGLDGSKGRIDASKYKQILYIKLAEHSKENVLDVIEILEKRDDVYCAEPNYKTVSVCASK